MHPQNFMIFGAYKLHNAENEVINKMVNGFRYYRALESVSIASALVYRSYHLPMSDPSPSTLIV